MREALNFISGKWMPGERTVALTDKFDGHEVATVHQPSQSQVDEALASLAEAFERTTWNPFDRYRALARAAELVTERADSFVTTIVDDTGFTIGDAERETSRCADTLLLCAEEAKRIVGEMVPLDGAPRPTGRIAFTVRRPLGIVCAIAPFNSPLNTVSHKVGPALAAGNVVILKPAALTPLTSQLLVETLLEAGVPEDRIALVQGDGATVGQWLLDDPRPSFYAFTGSTTVGAHIRRAVGLRRNQLELGSLSSSIVCDDAPIEAATALCINASFRKAGQVCTSIQRLYVHRSVIDELGDQLTQQLAEKTYGDPRSPGAFVGPVISEGSARRIDEWIEEAIAGGATRLTGGPREGSVIPPTVLADVTPEMRIMREEVFGPVLVMRPFGDLDDAIREANDTPYGLAAGIFTNRIDQALNAAEKLRMGSVHINETPSSRVDLMPYGGVKDSGLGQEGPHYAIREMTEEKLISLG